MRGAGQRLHLLANELDVPIIQVPTKCLRVSSKRGSRAGVRTPEAVAVESGFESGLDSRQGVLDLLKRSRKDVAALRRELQLEERGTDVHQEVSRAVCQFSNLPVLAFSCRSAMTSPWQLNQIRKVPEVLLRQRMRPY